MLSHSRKAYSEVVFKQTTDAFIQCIENAFHHFGGVPKTLVIDNLRAAVTQADWFDPNLNPKVQAFAAHYGTVILPTKPYTPRHKGKIERGIGYVKDNALKGRTFESLQAQNLHLQEWESTVADTRIHGTTRQQVGKVFEEVERGTLLPLPLERFPCFREAQRVVSRDAHVEVDKAFYSVPPEYLGRAVWARWDARMVRIFDPQMRSIAVHAKSEPGRFRTQPAHIAPEKISKVEKGTAWLLNKASAIGSNAQRWCESMLQHRGIEGVRVLQGLPKRSGECLFEIILRRYETRSTIMTSNRPLEDWGKLVGDVPSATAILDRFLHHAEVITITGKSYRLQHRGAKESTRLEEREAIRSEDRETTPRSDEPETKTRRKAESQQT